MNLKNIHFDVAETSVKYKYNDNYFVVAMFNSLVKLQS